MTRVKICGLSTEETLDAAVAAGADFVGFVFFPPSPRFVTPERAAALAARRGAARAVGLFVDPSDEAVVATLAAVPLDILQVNAPPARAAELRARFGRPVWRAVHVAGKGDLPASAEGADALLLDAAPPPGATLPGGNAAAFDWSILAGWRPGYDWLLAGGLTPDNVADAIRVSGAPGVDVSSGVERARGVKDAEKIRDFISAAKGASSR